MKSVFDDLPPKVRQTLARLYEMDEYGALRQAIELARVNAGKEALLAQSWDETKHLQGQAHGLKMLHLNLKELHKKSVKDWYLYWGCPPSPVWIPAFGWPEEQIEGVILWEQIPTPLLTTANQ